MIVTFWFWHALVCQSHCDGADGFFALDAVYRARVAEQHSADAADAALVAWERQLDSWKLSLGRQWERPWRQLPNGRWALVPRVAKFVANRRRGLPGRGERFDLDPDDSSVPLREKRVADPGDDDLSRLLRGAEAEVVSKTRKRSRPGIPAACWGKIDKINEM